MDPLFFSHDETSLLWLFLFGLLIWRSLSFLSPLGGIGLCHWFNLAINHFIGEVFINQNVDFKSVDRNAGIIGYQLSAWAIIGLLMAFFTVFCLDFRYKKTSINKQNKSNSNSNFNVNIGYSGIVYGMVCYFFLSGMLSFIPSITSILSAGLGMASAGLAWSYIVMIKKRGYTVSLMFSSIMFLFPIFTLVLNGFMGYGISAIFGVAGVVMVTHRPRFVIGLFAPGLLYLGLSLHPSYMLSRDEIRSSVWGGAEMGERFQITFGTLAERWEWFDPSDERQMGLFNGRLNQNVLVGASYEYISAGYIPFAEGETIYDGFLALIPRIIWVDKPIKAGSYGLASRFTGISFSEGTSVGIGNLMELYVNFNVFGIIIGFYIIGLCVYYLDLQTGYAIKNFNPILFFLSIVPGQSLMNSIGSFVEWGPSLVGSVVLAWIFYKFYIRTPGSIQLKSTKIGNSEIV